MRRWLPILILVFLPFQFTWAAVAGYCQHETGAAAQHFGHHDHQHQADADHVGAPDAKTLGGGIDSDCATCHAGCCAAIFNVVNLPASATASFAIPWRPGRLAAPPLAHPERPNWSVLA
ncbi:MAG: hypothetical protein IPO00_00515 [Betaproteobacteria bacterium]|nr:hypothetical protein [Betaproteobacteria bacterium]